MPSLLASPFSQGAQLPPPSLRPAVKSKRILVCVGSGGVGKTTTAAALGLVAARAGRRSLVMTIDPARRLAAAMGLGELDHRQQAVPAAKLAEAGLQGGSLHAMMLDPKHTFDELVRRFAPDPAIVQQLLSSRLYQQISSRLAGAQEYAAMEMLHEIWQSAAYELLVLDTPPAANALDFLEAPQKLVQAVQSPAVSLLIRTYQRAGRLSFNLLGFGASYVLRRLARFTGGEFLDDIAGLLTHLSGMLGGMHDRAAQVQQMLESPDVAFIIVTSPDGRSVDEAMAFFDRLRESAMSLAGFVINRVHPSHRLGLDRPAVLRLCSAAAGLPRTEAESLGNALLEAYQQVQTLALADELEIRRLVKHCGADHLYLRIPLFKEDIHDMVGLVKLVDHLG